MPNPMNHHMEFAPGDVLRLEVESATEGLPNLIQNPSGIKGAWFWVTPVADTLVTSPTSILIFRTNVAQAAYFTSDFIPMAAGRYVASRLTVNTLTASHSIRIRYEWYNASKALLSSSTQSSALTGTGVKYGPNVVAPANTAFVKMRVDLYNGTGTSNPTANALVAFNKAMLTHGASTVITSNRVNLVPNPSFETSTTGWIGSTLVDAGPQTLSRVTTDAHVGSACLRATKTSRAGRMAVLSAAIPVSVGKTYRAQARVKSTVSRRSHVSVVFYDKKNKLIHGGGGIATQTGTGTWTHLFGNQRTAPANAVTCRVEVVFFGCANNEQHLIDAVMLEEAMTIEPYFDGNTTNTGSYIYTWSGTANNSTSVVTTVTGTFDYSEPNDWINILGDSHSLVIDRKALDVGTLTASVLNQGLDPATTDYLRPGKRVRVRVLVFADEEGEIWDSLYEGRIQNVSTSYERDPSKPGRPPIFTPAGVTRRNLALNPSVRDLPPGWSSWTGSLTYMIGGGYALSGDRYIEYNLGAVSWTPNVQPFSNTTSPAVTAGLPYTFGVWARIHSGSAVCRANVQFANASNAAVGSVTNGNTFTLSSSWQFIGVNATAPSGATKLHPSSTKVEFLTGSTDGAAVRFDCVIVEQTTETHPEWFDGTDGSWLNQYDVDFNLIQTAEVSWLGTPHDSISEAVLYDVTPGELPGMRMRINLTATDNISVLANQQESNGVPVQILPGILEDKGVPWSINGSGNQVPLTAPYLYSRNDSATALDQVSLAAVSQNALAWVDRENVLKVEFDDADPFNPDIYLNDSDFTSAVMGYNSDACINEVTVNYLQRVTGENSEEVKFGPYRHGPSIEEYGAHAATFTIQGSASSGDPTAIANFAADILNRNAIPDRRVTSVVVPITTLNTHVLLADLCESVDFYSETLGVSGFFRVSGIKHTITTESWDMEFEFDVNGTTPLPKSIPKGK